LKRKSLNFFIAALFLSILLIGTNSLSAPKKNSFFKAATVYRISKYVDFKGREENIVICHNSDNLFSQLLNKFNVNKRIIVVDLKMPSDDKCDIVYLEASKPRELVELTKKYITKPTILVSDKIGFTTINDGTIEFADEENKFGLIINTKRASSMGIGFNSKLVESAILVF